MRRSKQRWCFVLIVFVLGLIPLQAAGAARELSEEVLTHLTKGFAELSENRLAAAQEEFAKVIREDFDNPFANNNLAVIMEKQGKLPDAAAYLKVAAAFAGAYHQKIETLYLIGGVVAAAKPEKATGSQSQIAPLIAENRRKLADKMGVPLEDTGPPPEK